MKFDGETYDPKLDGRRLSSQLEKVKYVTLDMPWKMLSTIADAVGGSEAGVSARLRDLRKPRFGGYIVERRRKAGCKGTWEYRVLRPTTKPEKMGLEI